MDEMTSGMAPVAPPTGQAQAPASPTPQTQDAASQTQGTDKPVNLQEFKEFRQYQSTMTRQLQEAQRRAQELEQKYREAATAGMDDVERTVFERDTLKAELEQLRQQQEIMQLQQARDARLRELSDEFDVPVDVIADAETPEQALYKAAMYLKTGRRQVANKPDLGGGGAVTTSRDSQYAQALKQKDPYSLLRTIMNQE